jgi:hypothetical protein
MNERRRCSDACEARRYAVYALLKADADDPKPKSSGPNRDANTMGVRPEETALAAKRDNRSKRDARRERTPVSSG